MKVKLIKSDFFYLLIITIIIIFFFLKLFVPEIKTFITPDIALSDQIHLNLSLKKIISVSLKKNEIPWWEPTIANGFPLIGESQIGFFYLPNLILFKVLPFELAFNFGYVFSFLICALGAYLFFKKHSKNCLASLLGSLFFTFSAPFFLQITHYNLLQTYSLIPLIFYCAEQLISARKKIIWLLLLFLLYSQQFFAGYIMTNLITCILLFFYIFLRKLNFKILVKNFIYAFGLIIVLNAATILLTSIQLIPLLEYTMESNRKAGMMVNAISNSLSLSVLKTYINFYAYGSPSQGNIAAAYFIKAKNTIWDTNMFFGITPFILSILGILIFYKKKSTKFFLGLYAISLILAFGKNSPFYVIFLLPFFNFFRTPSRFLILCTFFILAIFVLSLANLLKSKKITSLVKLLTLSLLIIELLNIFHTFWSYHPIDSFKNIYKNPIANFLHDSQKKSFANNQYKIYELGDEIIWRITLTNEGWKNISKYKFMQNDLNAYLNTVFGIPSSNLFFGSYFYPEKFFLYNQTIDALMQKTYKNADFQETILNDDYLATLKKYYRKKIILNSDLINLLRLKSVRFLITPFNIEENKDIKKLFELKKGFNINYYLRVYELMNSLPRFYLAKNVFFTEYMDDFLKQVEESKDMPAYLADQKLLNITHSKMSGRGQIIIVKDTSTNIKLLVKLPENGFLVNTDSIYSGWQVYVDSRKDKMIRVNINERGIILPKGEHIVEFIYQPSWYYLSLFCTITCNLLLLISILYYIFCSSKVSSSLIPKIIGNND